MTGVQTCALPIFEKKFVDRKPLTTAKISKKGRLAFEHYVEVLEEIVRK